VTLNIMTLGGHWPSVSGRRCHGHHREHQLASRAGQGRGARTSTVRRNRDPGVVSPLCICIAPYRCSSCRASRFLFVPMA
jgi:hypothetical protein